jgi:hypothetical protein
VSFQVIDRGEWKVLPTLERGWCSIARDGRAVFRAEDLALVKIEGRARLLADTGTLRVAIRRPRDDAELAKSMTVQVVKRGSGTATSRRAIQVGRAIKAIGVSVAACVGRYELQTKEDLLILTLVDISKGGGEKRARGAGEKERGGK